MMKKQYITIIFAVLGLILGLGSCKKDKIAPNRQQIAFIKYYGHVLDQKGKDIKVLTSEDGVTEYLILGSSKSFGSSTNSTTYNDMYLIKTDSLGNEIWSRKFGNDTKDQLDSDFTGSDDPQDYDEEGVRLLVLKDGSGYLLAGNRTHYVTDLNGQLVSADRKIVLYQVDLDGNLVSSYVHDYDNWDKTTACCSEILLDIVELDPEEEAMIDAPGKFLLTGNTTRVDVSKPGFIANGTDKTDIFTVKLDENFGTVWTATYGFVREDEGTAITVLDDGYVIAGMTRNREQSTNYQEAFILIKYKKQSGNIINTQQYQYGDFDCRATSMCWDSTNEVLTVFGNTIAANELEPVLLLLQADADFGTVKDFTTLSVLENANPAKDGSVAVDVVLLPGNEGYLLSATTTQPITFFGSDNEVDPNQGSNAQSAHIIKLDASLSPVDSRIMGYGVSGESGRIALLETIEEGATSATALGYVLTGTFDVGTNTMVGLVRMNTDLSFDPDGQEEQEN